MQSVKLPPHKIESWVAKHFDYKKRIGGNGEELILANPFYHNDKQKFNISLSKATCHDWRGDHWAGPTNPQTGKRNCSFIKFVRLYLKCSYAEAVKDVLGVKVDLKHYLNPDNRITDESSKSIYSVKLPESCQPLLPEIDDTLTAILVKWLRKRGYNDGKIIKGDLHYMGMNVYWPYYEFDTLVYWQSRSSLNKRFEFPALNVYDNKGMLQGHTKGGKGDYFYGFDDIENASYIIITESIFDKVTLGEQTVASGGAALTSKQVNKLRIIGPQKGVILSPDRDRAGIESIISNYNLLSSLGYKIYYSLPPDLKYRNDEDQETSVKDWNELGMHVCGFDKVRSLHDENIKLINNKNLVKIYDLLKSVQ